MRQIAIFVAVGCAAALTHLGVVALVVELLSLKPLAANAIGFGVAFFVSFAGHSRFTFPVSRESLAVARRRFFAVAFAGFAINQAAYAELLRVFGSTYYLPILAAVILGVAVATFLLSKLWAFAQPQG
ncbi:GtrA family protein [Rhodomicrobium lacus]|uniref:GtrA family protein n=1 Tax=Rhodomicrobium lacus TaxID=2498452 RepID=UPI0026E3B05A|nr:GtrA family protein [Rhodomicrobium lacus]WKW51835.1 GtrA family protein [Rhodomicrobium lacus]